MLRDRIVLLLVLIAVVLSVFDSTTISIITSNLSVFIIGVLVAFISGLLCIEFLLRYIKKNDFKVFGWYRIILGVLVLGYFFLTSA